MKDIMQNKCVDLSEVSVVINFLYISYKESVISGSLAHLLWKVQSKRVSLGRTFNCLYLYSVFYLQIHMKPIGSELAMVLVLELQYNNMTFNYLSHVPYSTVRL